MDEAHYAGYTATPDEFRQRVMAIQVTRVSADIELLPHCLQHSRPYGQCRMSEN